MGILLTTLMGFLLTITLGILLTIVLGIQFTISSECPNFFSLEDRWVLIQLTYPISYQVGQFDPDAVRFTPDGPARTLDYGYGPELSALFCRGLYGTTVTSDEQGRTLFFGWVGGFEPGHGWNGCMSLPRVLSFDDAGNLIQTSVRELEQLREKPICLQDLKLDNASRKLDEIAGDTIEFRATIIPGDAWAFGIRLRCADNRCEGIVHRLSRRRVECGRHGRTRCPFSRRQ